MNYHSETAPMSSELLTEDVLTIGSHELRSRLIVGTGKYSSYALMGESLERSGTDCITVAVRRVRRGRSFST